MNALIRIGAWLLAIALVALPVVAVLNGWIAGERWPMQRLQVNGSFERVQAEQIRAAVLPQARDGFFAVRLDAVRAAVAALPWVERVEVRKRWPDLLAVTVVEHRPFARWGGERIVSEHGRLFAAPDDPTLDTLPQLDGPDARVDEVVALYNQAQQVFTAAGERVRGVTLTARGSWSLQLAQPLAAPAPLPAHAAVAGTVIILGRDDAQPRLLRFARLMPRLLASAQRPLLRADLRYTNGFALTWQDAAPAPATGASQPGAVEGGAVDTRTAPLPQQART